MNTVIVPCALVTSRPIQSLSRDEATLEKLNYDAQNKPNNENDERVISVRITSSVAVDRGGGGAKTAPQKINSIHEPIPNNEQSLNLENIKTLINYVENETTTTEIAQNLIGANIEYIKQLNAKKETLSKASPIHPFQKKDYSPLFEDLDSPIDSLSNEKESKNVENERPTDSLAEESSKVDSYETAIQRHDFDKIHEPEPVLKSVNKIHSNKVLEGVEGQAFSEKSGLISKSNETDGTMTEPSNKSIHTIATENVYIEDENIENVPLARSVSHSPSLNNYIQGLKHVSPSERGNSPSLTTVSFDVVHDRPNQSNTFNNDPNNAFSIMNTEVHKFYEPPKVYSQPAKIYSEPAKFYSEPAKIYSEPAKIYSEPAKIYSEPAKIYSEPAKFYSEPASLHLSHDSQPNYIPWSSPVQSTVITSSPWQQHSQITPLSSTIISTTPTTLNTLSTALLNTKRIIEHLPEKNYEVDEKVSVLTDGRSHGVQETSTEKCKQDNCKVGYVVEGRQYKKYRVEERTADGFIVGEYGVVRNEDGALRGVRYTADSDASPRLIYDALMKFLQLK
ncbi:hypothetical protein evm_013244 [Chilo suppressalis]|nr:hypothetical protein evm_013244 [Chilo suppressalis]